MHLRRRRQPRRSRTLRWAWRSTVGRFVGVIMAVMAIALAATGYQRSVFTETMRDLEHETAALVALDRAILEATGPVTVVLYRAGDAEAVATARSMYDDARSEVIDAFDRAEAAVHTGEERDHLAEARAHWEGIDAAVVDSATTWTDAELLELLSTGQDPFVEAVWEPYDHMDLDLAGVRTASVADLRSSVDDADRLQGVIRPVFVGSLALALAFAFAAARRMTRHVLRPLADVGAGARAMRDLTAKHHIDVPDAVSEIRLLADDINESATSLRQSHGRLHSQAHTDEMTALPNRKAFLLALDDMLELNSRAGVAVLFVDLDDFKTVNDTMGHAAGDRLLRAVGRRVRAATRDCEIAARIGGDEFAVALEATDGGQDAVTVAERILGALDDPVQIQGRLVDVGCSIGIALSEAHAGSTSEELIGNADFAMYMAKNQGKGRHELYSPNRHAEMLHSVALRRDLAMAVERDQFELRYQPVLDLATGRLLAFEALVRWRHPSRGLLSPGEFISLAEESGLIREIGAWVLGEACAHLALQHEHDPTLAMSVNVSPCQLVDPEFARTVTRQADRWGISLERLVLEVTESTAMSNTERGSNVLEQLRSMGVHVALDDFGTGFSSLRYLGDLPADVIKIDRSFVAGTSENQRSTLEAIVALGQRLGLFIVAEGIERPEELVRLNALGRIAGQGYLFAEPLSAQEALAFRAATAPHASRASLT